VFHEEGGGDVSLSERSMRQVKRWVCVRRLCPILSLVMVIFWLREGRLEEDQGREEFLIWERILEC